MLRQMRQQRVEDLLLDVLALGGALDDEIGLAERRQILRRGDPRQRRLHRVGGDLATAHLPLKVLADQRHRLVQRLGADIVEQHLITRESHHMRDAIAHLACTHNAHCPDVHAPPPVYTSGTA